MKLYQRLGRLQTLLVEPGHLVEDSIRFIRFIVVVPSFGDSGHKVGLAAFVEKPGELEVTRGVREAAIGQLSGHAGVFGEEPDPLGQDRK